MREDTSGLLVMLPPAPPRPQAAPLPTFGDPAQRPAHVAAFRAWLASLPAAVREAPGIAWDDLPSPVMGYLIRTVATQPDAAALALAIGCVRGVTASTLDHLCHHATNVLRRLRARHGLQRLDELRDRPFWERLVAGRAAAPGVVHGLRAYETLTGTHLARYWRTLPPSHQQQLAPYRLPELPPRWLKHTGLVAATVAAEQRRRKDQSDVITPLYHLLLQWLLWRKHEATRLIAAFRRERARALADEIALPHAFVHTARLRDIPADAVSLGEVAFVERTVDLPLVLWDRVSWAEAHPERYARRVREQFIQRRTRAYAPDHTRFYLQHLGAVDDLLWFGPLLAGRLVGRTEPGRPRHPASVAAGEPGGFRTSRPGLLNPTMSDSGWLAHATVDGELVWEPESLYRGILVGAALATVAMTAACRVGELLQVSADRFELTRTAVREVVDGRPVARQVELLHQWLLPKGCSAEGQRQLFLIAEPAFRLLAELRRELEGAHGGVIPVVSPRRHKKAEDLRPERYLFQWAATADGRLGLLADEDVGRLLRFLFYGLELRTRQGEPIRVATHLLRHGLAQYARHERQVPAEALAYLLHHTGARAADAPGAAPMPAATAYYSAMPQETILGHLHQLQAALGAGLAPRALVAPAPDDLAAVHDRLRALFEQWTSLGPTTFGWCNAGICVRPRQRALCLDCPHLILDAANLPRVLAWRAVYGKHLELLEAGGQLVEARQTRAALDTLRHYAWQMREQAKLEATQGRSPYARLPDPNATEEPDA